jgi:hypothetical protein
VAEVYMDIPAVRGIAKVCSDVGETLDTVNKTLETLVTVLKTTAFMGLIGGLAVAQFIDSICPFIEQTAQKCLELNKDLTASVDAFERGDQQGAARFH